MTQSVLGRKLFVNGEHKGYVTGVYLSKKYPEIKCLHCEFLSGETACISFHTAEINDDGIQLSRLRAALPCNYLKLAQGIPLYNEKGALLGVLSDLQCRGGFVISLVTHERLRYPYSMLKAAKDALILRKKAVFPLGEPLPTPLQRKNASPFVNKKTLEDAVKKGELIQLTLSLSPFGLFGAI